MSDSLLEAIGKVMYLKKTLLKLLSGWISILLWEILFQVSVYSECNIPAVYLLMSSLAFATGLVLVGFCPGVVGRLIRLVLCFAVLLIYGVQLIYYEVFGSLLSLSFVSAGNEAVRTFTSTIFLAIWNRLLQVIALFIPFIVLLVSGEKLSAARKQWSGKMLVALAVTLCVSAIVSVCCLDSAAIQSASIDRNTKRYGLLTAELLEVNRTLFGEGQGLTDENVVDLTNPAVSGERNVLEEIDFNNLQSTTEDEKIRQLNHYFGSQNGTNKNEYTGLFEGYNLIVICAEAFSEYVIDPELTPTLYRMSTEGIVFENFYCSFPNLTTNGEYSLCTGLLPDMSRMSFAASQRNYLPYSLGNRLKAEGFSTFAYHNNIGTFYNRINTHTNLGYTFRAIDFGLDMEVSVPTSDLEMMEKTIGEYIANEPFHAYYMTYSGHSDYNFVTNAMCKKNQSLVEEIEASDAVRAYIACQLELEQAMSYLLGALEEAGIADRTVVVLTGDHFPYGLQEADYAELAGDSSEELFWKYRNSFLCWTGGLEEPIYVDDYCCTQDIVPTLLNLLGVRYDSRLLTGRDVLSDSTHLAVLSDGSFLAENLIYDADRDHVTWKGPADEEELNRLKQAVNEQFIVAAQILDTDYYSYLFSMIDENIVIDDEVHYASFSDISDTWYEEAVEVLVSYGALTGDSEGKFDGERAVTNAEFITMIARAFRLSAEASDYPYKDVRAGDWFEPSVAAAWEAGLLPEAEAFEPHEGISATDAAAVLQNLLSEGNLQPFLDEVKAKSASDADPLSRGAAAYLIAAAIQ